MKHSEYYAAEERLQGMLVEVGKDYMAKPATDFYIRRAQNTFDTLGNPEKGKQYIHVTGTSGKGSVSTMVYEMLRAAGKSVGLCVSPHVTTSVERVQVNGRTVAPELMTECMNTLSDVAEEIYAKDPEMLPSYPEKMFAAEILCLDRLNVDWIVVEVGAGGRYDMTNIIPPPVACIITNVDLDHTNILGDTVEKIAFQKAGIIKDGSAVLSSATQPSVREVIDAEAATYGTTVRYVNDFSVQYETQLPGKHQQANAALAAATGRVLGLGEEAIRSGIAAARLPARVEVMQDRPRVIIDGAHSHVKIAALVDALDAFRPWNKLHLIFTSKEGRDLADLVTPLAPLADTVTVTSFQLAAFGSNDAEETAQLFRSLNTDADVTIIKTPIDALNAVLNYAADDDLILVTGSLYFVGQIREHWRSNETILDTGQLFPA